MLGIMDSGKGGLSIYRTLKKAMPHRAFLYFGDDKNFPYGDKSAEEILFFAKQNGSFLLSKGATALVLACHTLCAAALQSLQEFFSVPLLGLANATLSMVGRYPHLKKIAILGTHFTITSNYYQSLFSAHFPKLLLYARSAPELVSEIESSAPSDDTIQKTLAPFPKDIDALLLLCTHFPLARKALQKRLRPGVLCLDPSETLVEEIERLDLPSSVESHEDRFYFSSTL